MWRDDPLIRALRLMRLEPPRVMAAVAAGVAALGSALALAGLSAWLIARAWQMPPVLDLSVAVVLVRALGISRGVFRYLERLASHDAALRGTATMREAIYQRLAHGDIAAVTNMRRGQLLTRTGEDVDIIGGVAVRALIPIAVAGLLSIAAVAVIAAISLPAAAILAGAIVFSGVIVPWISARRARAAEQQILDARAAFADRAVTVIDHAAELRVAGKLGTALTQARQAQERYVEEVDSSAASAAISGAAPHLAIGVSVLASLLFGLAVSSTSTPMALAVLVLLPLAAFESVAPLPEAALELGRARHAARRVMSLIDTAVEPDATGAVAFPSGAEIRTEGLTLPPGSRVAITGPSGAGKTTLLMTIAGILRPAAGSVQIGGVAVGDIDPTQLRREVTFFAEDAHVFETSVLENLRVANGQITEDDALRTLDLVGLGEWVHGLPDGLDTQLEGGDAAISGGQRRRLLLARALVSPASVLLLDEPTEHLDATDGDGLLRQLLDRGSGLVAADRTVVVVTHQLPQWTRADHVIEVKPGARDQLTAASALVSLSTQVLAEVRHGEADRSALGGVDQPLLDETVPRG